jgi:hypothetical protein
MWGGAEYPGVDAQYYQHPLQNPCEMIFYWDGHTLASGTVLWNVPSINTTTAAPFGSESQGLTMFARRFLPVITTVLGLGMLLSFLLARWKRTKNHIQINRNARCVNRHFAS